MQQMNQKNSKNVNSFSTNADGVSAVIGVILMVAVTVILAAVIAAFFFGMTENMPAAPGFAGFDVQRLTMDAGLSTEYQVVDVQTLSIDGSIESIFIKVDSADAVAAPTLAEVGGKYRITDGISNGSKSTVLITGKQTNGKTVMLYEVEV